MTIKHDKVVVVDIEATCWRDDPPPGQQREIIEVGVCLVDTRTYEPSAKRSLIVRPEQSAISEFCTELTTLTQERVDAGMTFLEACTILEKDYETRNRLWASWGAFDRRIFKDQCKARGVRYPYSKKHVNLKRLFADHNQKQRVAMVQALILANLELQGTLHRGDDDAWNIARLLGYLLRSHGVDILRKYW